MILITGGAGYIGAHTNKLLNKLGYQTVVFDNLVTGHQEFIKWGSFFKGDLQNESDLEEVFKKYSISAVMHFAGYAYVGESVQFPDKYYQNNVVGTLNLLKVMKKHQVKQIVFSSTCATYGIPEKNPITENQPQKPISPYGHSKLLIEKSLQDFFAAYGLNSVSLRYFNAAGASEQAEIGEWRNPETRLIPLVLDVALGLSEHIKIFGNDYKTKDGTCIRDYIHVDDLAMAHVQALEYLKKNSVASAFNLGNGQGFSVSEVIAEVQKVTLKKIPVIIAERRAGDPEILVGDATRAFKELGWKPQYPQLNQIIASAWKWHQLKPK